ncbi:DUF2125 domain-containing protein [Paenirhodobacter populi]|uniref:DUF2125 domain-containing protein n=1 Tax=Paenirhodobacter populi TaxID=2306993 RepID=UPI000FE3B66C|nr:DUF2125 domain-containing protein [Sinirhodobacter populi]RWR10913.1 DUF2125 domain-containing protein [Sinirhodobacter populi]
MAQRFTPAAAAAIVMALAGGAAQAVTADEVWDIWQRQYSGAGYSVAAAARDRQGDTLVLRDVALSSHTDSAQFDMTVPEIRLREIGDGRVEVTFSPEARGQSTATPEDGTPVTMDMVWQQRDSMAIVSGTPDNLGYDVTSPEVSVEMTETPPAPTPGADGAPAQLSPDASPRLRTKITAQDIVGNHLLTGDAQQQQQSQVTVKSVQIDASGADADSDNGFTLTGAVADLVMSGRNLLPRGAMSTDMDAALSAGMQMDADMRYGASDFTVETTSDEGPMTIRARAAGGNLDMALSPQAMRYAGGNTDATLEMTSSKLPAPLSATLASTNFDLSGPLAKSDTPQPFTAKLGLTDLRLSDTAWQILDQAGRLPHDPATVTLDLTGMARPLVDLFAQGPAAPAQGLPVEVSQLDINTLHANAAGAELTGTGALSFDNSQGLPVPDGTVDLSLTGGVKLLESLSEMGIVQRDQIMLARMLLGLYAVPSGDDAYSSQIEFRPSGEILANGQRIR